MLIERDHELSRLDELLDSGLSGAGAAALIEGPAGIGKTALLDAARAIAERRGATVLAARGDEMARDASFAAVRELFAAALTPQSAWSRERLFADAAHLAQPALGLSAAPSPDSAETRFARVYGLYWLTINLAHQTPVLLVIDDLHAVDADSLHWLSYMLRNLSDSRLAILLGGRSVPPGAIDQDTTIERIAPRPLTSAGVQQLAATRLGDCDARLADDIHEATGGIPFLVNAALAALATDGANSPEGSAHRIRELAAVGVSADLLSRVGRVASGAIEVAQVAALLGPGAGLHRIAALATRAPEEVVRVCDGLTADGFTRPGWPVRFTHPLIEEAVLATIPRGRRSELHGRAAELMAAEPAGGDLGASHLLQAEPRGDPHRAQLLLGAGRRALLRGAPLTAATYLGRALREPPAPSDVPPVLLELGRAETQANEGSALDHLAQAADLMDEPAQRAKTLWELSQAMWWAGDLGRALEAGRRALDAAPVSPGELRLEMRAELFAIAQMDVLAEPELDALARDLDVEAGASDSTVAGRRMLGAVAFMRQRHAAPVEEVVNLARRALADGELQPEVLRGSAAFHLAQACLINAGELELSRFVAKRAAQWARTHGAPGLFAIHIFIEAQAAMFEGDLRAVDELCTAAWESSRAGAAAPLVTATIIALRIRADIERGRVEAARDSLERTGIAAAPASELLFSFPLFMRAMVLRAEGHTRRALEDLLAAGERCRRVGNQNPLDLEWRLMAAELHAQLGEHEQAVALADEELRLARHFGANRSVGMALRTRGIVTGGLRELNAAVETLARSSARLEHAKALVALGAAQRRAGQRRAARASLRAGHELAHRCGADPLTAHAEDELRTSGARLVDRPITGLDALTPSERRIASLAADGHTNPQIAQSLFLSLKTVETHLGRTYRKLGIASRTELPEALGRVEQAR